MSVDYIKVYEQYQKRLQEKALEVLRETQKKTFADFFELAGKKIQRMYKMAIDLFYADYAPLYYGPSRRGSLYELLEVKVGDDYLSIGYDPKKISPTGKECGEDILYTTIFKEGWHGGASHNGSMYWRTPYLVYRYWGREATRTEISPYDLFNKLLDRYEERDWQKDYNKMWEKNKSNIKLD